MLTTTAQGLLDDRRRIFGPYERRRVTVPLGDVGLNMTDQRAECVEGATPNRFASEDAEPGFDHVEPGGALRGEVELDFGMLSEPRLHRRRRMRGRIVEDDVQGTAAVASRHPFEEAQEIRSGMARRALAQDASAADFQGGVETGQP